MDLLSELLLLLRPDGAGSAGFNIAGDWSIRFNNPKSEIKCYVVEAGQCWLAIDGLAVPIKLAAGDCLVLPTVDGFRLASDLTLPSIEAAEVFAGVRAGEVVSVNGGGGFRLVASRFVLGGRQARTLLAMLPPVVHIRTELDQAAIRWLVNRMMQELDESRLGGHLVAMDLARMILVLALRAHLVESPPQGASWFAALADERISRAIKAMHTEPSRRWNLHELAERAGMSRSIFAERFKAVVGEPPMQYLTRWRMLLACDRLERTSQSVSMIANALGYDSESAFSNAFRRSMGAAPRDYRRM